MTRIVSWAYFFLALTASIGVCGAQTPKTTPQRTVIVGEKFEDGSIPIMVDGVEYLAITSEMGKAANLMKVDLDGAKKENKVYLSLIESYKETLEKYDLDRERQDAYARELESTVDTYRKLVAELKKAKTPLFTGRLGAGFSGADYSPILLAGLGVGSFRIWGFAQEDNPGLLVGMAFPFF